MKEKLIGLRKRLAMGDTVKGYAKGGAIGALVKAPVGVPARPLPSKPSANPMSELEKAKRDNGIRGMKKGGRCMK